MWLLLLQPEKQSTPISVGQISKSLPWKKINSLELVFIFFASDFLLLMRFDTNNSFQTNRRKLLMFHSFLLVTFMHRVRGHSGKSSVCRSPYRTHPFWVMSSCTLTQLVKLLIHWTFMVTFGDKGRLTLSDSSFCGLNRWSNLILTLYVCNY